MATSILDFAAQQIHGFYLEARRMVANFDQRKAMGMRPTMAVLSKTIAAGNGGAAPDFRVSNDEDFIVYEIRGMVALSSWSTEPAFKDLLGHPSEAAAVAADPYQRMLAKANNCRFKITDKDSKIDITDYASGVQPPLSSIMPEFGGQPIKFGGETRPSWVIPHSKVITATFTLQDTDAALIGSSTDYGVILTGVYIAHADTGNG